MGSQGISAVAQGQAKANTVTWNGNYKTVSNTTCIDITKLAKAANLSTGDVLKKYDLDGDGYVSSYGLKGDEIKAAQAQLSGANINVTDYKSNISTIDFRYNNDKLFDSNAYDKNGEFVQSVLYKDSELLPRNVNIELEFAKNKQFLDFDKDYNLVFSHEKQGNREIETYSQGLSAYPGLKSIGNLKTYRAEQYKNKDGQFVIKDNLKLGELQLTRYDFYEKNPNYSEDAKVVTEKFYDKDQKPVTLTVEGQDYDEPITYIVTDKDGNKKYYLHDGSQTNAAWYGIKNRLGIK